MYTFLGAWYGGARIPQNLEILVARQRRPRQTGGCKILRSDFATLPLIMEGQGAC